jgi:hypothetical protein
MFKRIILALFCVTTVFNSSLKAESESSGHAAAYLQMGIGARALGMGGAFAAVSDDSTATFWNPAGLTQLKKSEFSAMTSRINLDRSYNYVNFAKPMNNGWTFGFTMLKFGVEDISETRVLMWEKGYDPETSGFDKSKIVQAEYSKMHEYGEYVYHKNSTDTTKDYITPVTENIDAWLTKYDGETNLDSILGPTDEVKIFSNFEDKEMAFIGSFAKKYDEKLSLGANLKYLYQEVFSYKATAIGVDLGALYQYNSRFNFGLVVKDLFATMKWDTHSKHEDKLPLGLVFATSYKIFDKPYKFIDQMLVAFDVNKIEDNDATIHVGLETWIKNVMAVRAGVNDQDLTVGATFKYNRYSFDYSFGKQELGDIQRVSMSVKF